MSAELVQYTPPAAPSIDNVIADIEKTKVLCSKLMATKHYASLGDIGVFAILQKAQSIGMSPMDALNGGMYFVQGKVELTAQAMNMLIRSHGHSIKKDAKSDKTCCILHGRRADNADTWIVSFSVADAKQAGIAKGAWNTYPEDMCFNRALSRLARQLFPDVIKGCYVEGEIRQSIEADAQPAVIEMITEEPAIMSITQEQADELDDLIGEDTSYRKKVMAFLKKECKADNLNKLPVDAYSKIYRVAEANRDAALELIKANQVEVQETEAIVTEEPNE